MKRPASDADSEAPAPPRATPLRTPPRGGTARIWSAPRRFFGRLVRGARRDAQSEATPATGADTGLDSVARALGSDDASARLLALEVILGYSADRAAGLLAAAIHDPDRGVRRAAIAAAGRMRAERAASSLILALDTPDTELRTDALRALEQITGRAVDAADIDDAELRSDTLDALRNWWKRERVKRLAKSYGVDA